MMREKTIEKITKGIIAKEMTIDAESITRNTNLVSIVNIVTAIESKFKITFPDDSKISYDGYTLQFLIDGVTNALKEKSARGVLPRTRKEKPSEN